MPITFTLTPREKIWIAGSRMVVDLRIANSGPDTFSTPNPEWRNSPQPVFHLTVPGGETADFPASGDPQRASDKPTLIHVAPGQEWSGGVAISDLTQELALPGIYQLSAEIDWDGQRVEAEEVSFEIAGANFTRVSPSVAQAQDGEVTRECLLLLEGGQTPHAVAALLEEEDASNGEMAHPDLQMQGELPSATQDVHGVFANYSTGVDYLRWHVCSSPEGVFAGNNMERTLTRLEEGSPRQVLTPLALKGHRLLVPALFDSHIAVATVTPGRPLPATARWRTVWKLSRPAALAASAPGSEASDGAMAFGVAHHLEGKALLRITSAVPGREPEAFLDHEFEGWQAEGAMAMHWDSLGQIRAAFFARATGPEIRRGLIEVVCSRDLSLPPRISILPAPGLKELSGGAAIAYFEAAPGSVTRAAALQSASEFHVLDAGNHWRPAPAPLKAPFALIPGRSFWYVVWAGRDQLRTASF